MSSDFLELVNIRKSFGLTRALHDASLSIARGEITVLAGQNGAGKSTLMRIAAGILQPDSGHIEIEGVPVRFRTPLAALSHHVAMVHQHFALVNEFSIAENLALADRALPMVISGRAIIARAETMIERSGLALENVARPVSDLSVGEKSKLELIKALSTKPRLLILDEPTSVLAPPEVQELSIVLRRMAADDAAVVVITHKIGEIFDLADRIVVLRAGRIVESSRKTGTTPRAVAAAMIGDQEIPQVLKKQPARTSVILRLTSIHTTGGDHRTPLSDLSLELHRGEITAIIGVAGNGQQELAELLRGLVPARSGTIELADRRLESRDLRKTKEIAHIPADRTSDGVVREMTLAENLALKDDHWDEASSLARGQQIIERHQIQAHSGSQRMATLSGGNQQKLLLARELESGPAVVIAAEPTRGLDVASTQATRDRLERVADEGGAILLLTSDLEEAFELADTIHVIYCGRLSERLDVATARDRAATLMAGLP